MLFGHNIWSIGHHRHYAVWSPKYGQSRRSCPCFLLKWDIDSGGCSVRVGGYTLRFSTRSASSTMLAKSCTKPGSRWVPVLENGTLWISQQSQLSILSIIDANVQKPSLVVPSLNDLFKWLWDMFTTDIFCKQFLFQTFGECLVGGTGLQRATSGDQGLDQRLKMGDRTKLEGDTTGIPGLVN